MTTTEAAATTEHKQTTGHERHGRCAVCREEVHEYPYGIDHPGNVYGGDPRITKHEPDPEWTCCK